MSALPKSNLADTQKRLKSWLFDHALPMWWEVGGDTEKGGFFEKLGLDAKPVDDPRRTRVAARQVYSYALAQRMGYTGETDAAIDQGLKWLSGPARTPDGLLYAVLAPDGSVIKGEFDFYDHAFALLAYASAFKVRPHDKSLEAAGVAIRDHLLKHYKHPVRGFEEANPRTLPLKTNPHMHMFEACLAWIEAGGDKPSSSEAVGQQKTTWHEVAAEIASLCLDKFLHPQNGSLREYFDGDWNPLEGEMGRIIEPGHQFEWAWLLIRWAGITGDNRFTAPAKRLIEIAEVHGTDLERNVTIFELWDDFSPKDQKARLWAQTERMKAYVALYSVAETDGDKAFAVGKAVTAAKGLELYLNTDIAGLYLDKMYPDGSFVDEPAPASSLYHIICAIDELHLLAD